MQSTEFKLRKSWVSEAMNAQDTFIQTFAMISLQNSKEASASNASQGSELVKRLARIYTPHSLLVTHSDIEQTRNDKPYLCWVLSSFTASKVFLLKTRVSLPKKW